MAHLTVATPGAQGWTPVPEMYGILRAAKLEMEPLNLDGTVGGRVVISLRCRRGGSIGAPPGLSLPADTAMVPGSRPALPRSSLPPGKFVVNAAPAARSGGSGQPPAAPAGFAPEAWSMPRAVCRFSKGAVSPHSGSSTRSSSGGSDDRGNGSVEERMLGSEVAMTRAPPGVFRAGAAPGHSATVAPSPGDKCTGGSTTCPASDILNVLGGPLPRPKAPNVSVDLDCGGSDDEEEEDVDNPKKKKKTRYCKKSRDQYRRLVDRIIADMEGTDPEDFVLDVSRLPKTIASSEEARKSLMATVIKVARARDASAKSAEC